MNNCVQVLEHIPGGDPKHAYALLGEPLITHCILLKPSSMALPVDFDAKLGRIAIEIEDVRAGRVLAAKAHAGLLSTECLPK